MQNETQNQDTNTQVTQEESPAHNETPQNQDIDPAVTMSSDDLFGSDPNVTMYPEDLLGPEPAEEPNPNVTMRPEDLLDPEEPDLDEVIYDWGLGRPSEEPDLDEVIYDWGLGRPSEEPDLDEVIYDWSLGRPPEGGPQYGIINPDGSVTQIIEADPSEPVITDWGLGRPSEGDQQYIINPDVSVDPIITDWGLGRPSEPETIDLAAPSAEEAGLTADSDPDIQGGCAFDYEYDEYVGACTPSYEDFNFFPILYGDKPLPDTAGGYVALPGEAGGDLLLGLGGSISGVGGAVEKGLNWYGEDGGPIGWGFQGLGHTIGYATGAAGTIVAGAGEVVGGVSEGVGDAVDTVGDAVGAVGDAAEDALDEISSWW